MYVYNLKGSKLILVLFKKEFCNFTFKWALYRNFCVKSQISYTIRFTSPQGYLGKVFCWFSWEVFKLEISPIPIFASSFQGLSDEQVKFSLQPTQQLTLDKTWFWAIYLTDNKTFLILKCLLMVQSNYL